MLNDPSSRLRGAIGFHRPTHEQQSQHEAENQLLLFGQHIHPKTLATTKVTRNCVAIEFTFVSLKGGFGMSGEACDAVESRVGESALLEALR